MIDPVAAQMNKTFKKGQARPASAALGVVPKANQYDEFSKKHEMDVSYTIHKDLEDEATHEKQQEEMHRQRWEQKMKNQALSQEAFKID